MRKKEPACDLLEHERRLWQEGFQAIAGVDEVGRGPLAGPVVACACIVPKGLFFEGVQDSKKLSKNTRERLSQLLTSHPDVHYSLGVVCHKTIDERNILRATLLAMKQAVEGLKIKPDCVLVDGRDRPDVAMPAFALIGGDERSHSIASASIIAKQWRDALMDEYHQQYPEYGFDRHKGYGTRAHFDALHRHGPCPIHRKTFLRS